MPRFIELNNFDIFEQFAASLNRVRKPLSYAYCEAFQAFERSRDLLNESERESGWYSGGGDQQKANELHGAAFTEDVQADMFASIAVLFADDVLRRFHWGLFGKMPKLKRGYGRKDNDVALSVLLLAGGNAIRHASWWAENVPFPYPKDDAALKEPVKTPLASIRVIEKAFGSFGGPIITPPSWDIIFRMNAGDDFSPGEKYDDYERAIVLTALDMAKANSKEAAAKLKAAVDWIDLPE